MRDRSLEAARGSGARTQAIGCGPDSQLQSWRVSESREGAKQTQVQAPRPSAPH